MTLLARSQSKVVVAAAIARITFCQCSSFSTAICSSLVSMYAPSPCSFCRARTVGRVSRTFPPNFHNKCSPTLSQACRFSSFSNSLYESEPSSKASLPHKTGDRNGLIRHELIADDGHLLRLYSRTPSHRSSDSSGPQSHTFKYSRSILLLHGRTWSSQPVFDLRTSESDEKQQSTLQSLADLGFIAYALDFRGFGETPRDVDTHGYGGFTTPNRCVLDVKCAIQWMTERHCKDGTSHSTNNSSNSNPTTESDGNTLLEDPTVSNTKPALLGWSQGALIAQMYAQQYGPSTMSDLVLFGSIYDPRVIYPRKPLYDPLGRQIVSLPDGRSIKSAAPQVPNTDVASLEDFTLPGTICDEAARTFSSLALTVDPIKAAWDDLHQFNVCNPAVVHVPTLVIAGSQDPYVSWEAQRELFERLGTEDKAWCILPGCDHAAHILKARKMFIRNVAGFLLRKESF